MSIIEKAVSGLEKKAAADVAAEQRSSQPAQPDTVQKVATGVESQSETRTNENAPSSVTAEIAAGTHADLSATAARELFSTPDPTNNGSTSVSTTSSSDGRATIRIPFDNLYTKGMITPGAPRSIIAEEYRAIKRPLLKNIDGKSAAPIPFANLVMVTSALQNEGKTFSSINLALSIAMEMDKTVLFVDADTSKASAGDVLGVPKESLGLIDVLEDTGVSLGDVILNTNMEKLKILPAGKVHAHSTELLASDSMKELMQELSKRYSDRVIVFDSPPLLLTNEAGVLANLMGQIVLVVMADVTPQHAISEAIEHIAEDKMVGLVLNRTRRNRGKLFGYGYGYGYGYGSDSRGRTDHSYENKEA